MEDEELREGYIKVQYDLAPKTNGKKFATWCEKYGFTPLNGGRRAWNSGLGTYLRGASGVAFADGEMFLFYEEDLIDIEAKIVEARIDEPEERTEINKILHNKIFACLMGNMTIPQARVQATTMMYTINSHLSKYWSPKQAYCRKQQLHGRQIFLCDRDIRHEGECSWELVDKIKQLETRLTELKKEKH